MSGIEKDIRKIIKQVGEEQRLGDKRAGQLFLHTEGWKNIKSFGAKVDDSTDDTAAIQAAIDKQKEAGWYYPILLPIGTSIFSSLTLHPQTYIIGIHPTLSILKRKAGSTGIAIEDDGSAAKIKLENFTLNCNGLGTDGIKLGFNATVWNYMAWLKGIRIMNHTGGIGFNLKANVAELEDCWAELGLKGFCLEGNDIRMSRCSAQGQAGSGAYEICLNDIDRLECDGLHIETAITDKPIQIIGSNQCMLNNVTVSIATETTIIDVIEFLTSGNRNKITNLKIDTSKANADFTNAINDSVNSITIDKNYCYLEGTSFHYLNEYSQGFQNERARAYLSASQSNITNITWTKINFNAETYDLMGRFDVANYKFTAPVKRYYRIHGQVTIDKTDLVADVSYWVRIYVNGVGKTIFLSPSPVGGNTHHHAIRFNETLLVDKNEDLEIYFYHSAGADTIDILGGEDYTFVTFESVYP